MVNLLRKWAPVDRSNAVDLSRILLHADPGSEDATKLRSLAQEVFARVHALQRVAVIPVDYGHTSRLLSNLAFAIGETQQRIALIEADLRSPQIATRFKLTSALGLAGVLEEKIPLATAECAISPWLSIIPGGQPTSEPAGLLNLPRFSEIVGDVAQRNALTFVSCPPASRCLDYNFIVRSCEGIVIVAQKDKSRMSDIFAVRDHIERLGVPLVYALLENGKF